MDSEKIKKYAFGLLPIAVYAVIFAAFFRYTTPEKIAGVIGGGNAYIIMFFLAFFGGLTTFISVPYHAVLISMIAAGEGNPLLLGSAAALGVMSGDSTTYYLGYTGRRIAPEFVNKFFSDIYASGAARPWALPLIFMLYGALIPLSNDFLTISSGIARYPFLRVVIPLGIGNLIFNIGLAFLAPQLQTFIDKLPL